MLCAVIARPSYNLAGGVDVIGAAVGVRKLARTGVEGKRAKVLHTSTFRVQKGVPIPEVIARLPYDLTGVVDAVGDAV
jgi:hypothetical protein